MKRVELQQNQSSQQQSQQPGTSFQTSSQTPLLETKEVLIGKGKMSQQQIDQLQQQQVQLLQQQENYQQLQQEQQMIMKGQQQITAQLLPALMTPVGEQRSTRSIQDHSKYQRFLPQEDPKNLIVESGYQSTLYNLGQCVGCLGQYFPCWCPNPNVQVNNSFKGIYERFGKYVKTVGAGLHFVNPYTDTITQIDCKTLDCNLGMQSSITQDNLVLLIHGVVQYRVIDCRQAHYSLTSIYQSVKELAICALRSTISSMKYQSILDDRQLFKKRIEQFMSEYIQDWGVNFEQVIIKEMSMDSKTQESLAQAAKEMRLAQAKILSAKADVAAAEEQQKAIDQLSSKAAMEIRFLSSLEKVASKSKVVFLSD